MWLNRIAFCFLFIFLLRNDKVEYYSHQSRKSDTSYCETAECQLGTAYTKNKYQ